MTDPRISARRVEVQRTAGRRRLSLLLAVLALGALGGISFSVLHSSLFSARHVRIVGGSGIPRAALLSAAGLADHPPLIDIDTAAAAARLERLPEVATAAVHLDWPSGVNIDLTLRAPVAVVSAGVSGWAVVDATGRVLSVAATRPPALPAVTSVGTPGPPGTTLSAAARPLLQVAAGIGTTIGRYVKAVGEDSGGDIVLVMDSGPIADLGDPTQLRQKVVSLLTLIERVNLNGIVTIDLRVPAAPVLTPTGSGPTLRVIPGG
jgi:cell division protein FtsQ